MEACRILGKRGFGTLEDHAAGRTEKILGQLLGYEPAFKSEGSRSQLLRHGL